MIRHVSRGLEEMLTICQGTCRQSRKAEAYTLRQNFTEETKLLLQQPWLRAAFAYPWWRRNKKKRIRSWRRVGWLGINQEEERHIQKWVRLSSPGTCSFAPGNICPCTTHSAVFPWGLIQSSRGCGICLYLAWSRWAFWNLYFSRRELCMWWLLSTHIFLHH